MKPISVLIVDNYEGTRRALRKLLSLNQLIEVVGEARNGKEAIAKVEELRPELVLMDVKMPKMDGIKATRFIKGQYAKTVVVMLSAYDGESLVDKALKSGASAYLLKDSPIEDIVHCIIERCSEIQQKTASTQLAEFGSKDAE